MKIWLSGQSTPHMWDTSSIPMTTVKVTAWSRQQGCTSDYILHMLLLSTHAMHVRYRTHPNLSPFFLSLVPVGMRLYIPLEKKQPKGKWFSLALNFRGSLLMAGTPLLDCEVAGNIILVIRDREQWVILYRCLTRFLHFMISWSSCPGNRPPYN